MPCRSRRVGHVWSFGVVTGSGDSAALSSWQGTRAGPCPGVSPGAGRSSHKEPLGLGNALRRGSAFVTEEPEVKAAPGECPAGGPSPARWLLLFTNHVPSLKHSPFPSPWLRCTMASPPQREPLAAIASSTLLTGRCGVHRTTRDVQPPHSSSGTETYFQVEIYCSPTKHF